MGFKSYQKTLNLTLKSGLIYNRVVDHPFILLSAKLSESTKNEDKVQVIFENNNEDKFKLCTLWKKHNIDGASLSILFSKGDQVSFYLHGEAEVVLSGFFVVDSSDSQALAKDISKNAVALKQDILSKKKNKKNVVNGIKENKEKMINGEKKNFNLKNREKNNKNKSPEKTVEPIQEIDLVDESVQEICQDDSIVEMNNVVSDKLKKRKNFGGKVLPTKTLKKAKKSVEKEKPEDNLLTFFKNTEEKSDNEEESCVIDKLKKKLIKRKFTFKEKKAKQNLDSFLEDAD